MPSMICLIFSLFLLSSALSHNIPSLSVSKAHYKITTDSKNSVVGSLNTDGYQIYNYMQTLDHFNYNRDSYTVFPQRYAINRKYWGGMKSNSPIFVYLGGESKDELADPVAFLLDNAAHFQALLVVIEHRYYGQSYPFGSEEEAFQNSSTTGYLSATQALADYAQLITDLKKNLSAVNCPVIAVGGSYSGMLASWFRLKYSHIVIGAFASSAPVLYFDDITPQDGYSDVLTKNFQKASQSCYKTIKKSWSDIDELGAKRNGLNLLSQIFHTCSPLNSTKELKDKLADIYTDCAQYGPPPPYSDVEALCARIDGFEGASILDRIYAGIRKPNEPCLKVVVVDDDDYLPGWAWQTCTEIIMPMGVSSNTSLFQKAPFDVEDLTEQCQTVLGATPRPNWVTTEFGGHSIKFVLENFGSNIIFSNGLRDPYSSGGVLYNISDSIVAINTEQGTHTMDLLGSQSGDPDWLTGQKNAEIKIMDGWINDYQNRFSRKANVCDHAENCLL